MEGETLTPSVEIVGGKEHGKEQQNPRIRLDGDKEADEFRFPRRMFDSDHSGTIGADHLVRVDQGNREDNADKGKDQETNLQMTVNHCIIFCEYHGTYIGSVAD